MSEEENMNDDTEFSTETSIRETHNPFLERLEENQRAQAKAALIKTICENVDQTVGAVYDALDADDSGDYIMLDLFKRMTIRELVMATVSAVDMRKANVTHPAEGHDNETVLVELFDDDDDEDDDEDELVDDDEDEVDDEDEDEDELIDDDDDEDEIVDDDDEEEEEEPPAPPVKKKKSKKKGKNKKGKGAKGKKTKAAKGATDGPTTLGAYKKRMLKHLRKASEPLSAQALKELIGGDKDLFTQAKDALLEDGEIESEGKARGTKYSIA